MQDNPISAGDSKASRPIEQKWPLSGKKQQEVALKQIDITVDAINSYLANVCLDSDRFKFVLDGEQYKALFHGRSVASDDTSTDERDTLVLCCFFTEGGEGGEQDYADDDPQYAVLDDPISGFDTKNRIDVYSLIRE